MIKKISILLFFLFIAPCVSRNISSLVFCEDLVAQEVESEDNIEDKIEETNDILERVTDLSENRGIKKSQKQKKEKKAKKSKEGKVKITEVVAGIGNFTQVNLNKKIGRVALKTKARTGAVGIYLIDNNKHSHSIFSTDLDGCTSSFWLREGSRAAQVTNIERPGAKSRSKEILYKLTNSPNIVTSCRDIPNGVAVSYVIPKKVRLVVTYEALGIEAALRLLDGIMSEEGTDEGEGAEESNNSTPGDISIIKVTATMENRGSKTGIWTLKGVFDTYLGEGSASAFSTNNNKYVKSESYFDNFDWLKEPLLVRGEDAPEKDLRQVNQDATLWLETKNARFNIKFLTAGRGITSPDRVVAASLESLSLSYYWQPAIKVGRDFDTETNYGNSALGFYWDPVRLSPRDKSVYTYYIALSVMDEYDSEEFLKGVIETEKKEVEQIEPPPETPDIDLTLSDGFNNGKFVFDESTITSDKLNYDYVESLIERINEIESGQGDFDTLDNNELLRLNAEIDLILARLKGKK